MSLSQLKDPFDHAEQLDGNSARTVMHRIMDLAELTRLSDKVVIDSCRFDKSPTLIGVKCLAHHSVRGHTVCLHHIAKKLVATGYSVSYLSDGFMVTLPIEQFDALVDTPEITG